MTDIRRQQDSLDLVPDSSILNDLEDHARSIASNLDMALRDLRGSLHGMSDLTSESMQVFNNIVTSTCDQVDAAIRSTYAMLAKAEEFSEAMREMQNIFQQIKDVKQLLNDFELKLISNTSITQQK
ncbi:hypothetical protein Mgra_00009317 [Meloidogyne graminicola]|uniref:BLOC-1-related complex subunit 6 C-terminal helix domain-containing protein n=1 Tax=Meloidogyne graminicola TaxID=189291 RepID=A0A8S9ZC32_9BILA|nr:hypothetical protein Mgra_00009317 [Meloidogyne graminicola]